MADRDAATREEGEPLALRLSAGPFTLIRLALGGPREIFGKCVRIGRTIAIVLSRSEVDRRLRRLQELGFIERRPSRLQIFFGGLDMLRFLIEPGARDYYRAKGISFGFHQLLRVLDDPVSMIDPTGFLSDRDTIVGHVMQVVHLNPIYDLQLIQMFEDGPADLESQVEQMVAGSHPRQATIGAIVEDPGYHARLLDYVRHFRADPETKPLVRAEQTLRANPHFAAAERTFATLPGFIAYCLELPEGPWPLARRFASTREFPIAS